MSIYLLVTLSVLLLAYKTAPQTKSISYSGRWMGRVSKQGARSYLFLAAICILLIAPEALRVNVGNDYAKYVEFMHLIRCDSYVPTEIGFNTFVKVIYSICGYENYLLVFGLFATMTVLLFVAAMWQQADNFAFTFFLFMMFGYYFQSYNTVRYYFALAIVVYATKYLLSKEFLPFFFLIALAATFHKSVLVVLLLYPLAMAPFSLWFIVASGALCVSFLFLQDMWLKVVVFLYPSYEDTEYLAGSGLSYVNIARCAGILLLAVWVYRKNVAEAGRKRFYFHLNLIALALYVFCSFLPIISRIGYYLTISQIFYLPMILSDIPKEKETERKWLTRLVIVAAILFFILFMRRLDSQELRILPYQSFLFHDMPAILSDVNS